MIIAEQLTIFSQNCRCGLSVASKGDLFQYIRVKKYNIICLQDVHINDNVESLLKQNGDTIYFQFIHNQESRGYDTIK